MSPNKQKSRYEDRDEDSTKFFGKAEKPDENVLLN